MTRMDWEKGEILDQFRDWLAQTTREIDDLDNASIPGLWKQEDDPPPLPETGLLPLVEAVTAMRHELKLQTRNGRLLEESVQAARQNLDAAMRQFQSVQAREEESARRAALPLVETLAGLDESLWRGAKAFEVTYRQMTETAPRRLREILDQEYRRVPWWRRWLIGRWHARVREQGAAEMTRATSEEFARLMEGYQLIQDRLQQELQKHGVTRVATVGRRVDPTCMMVVQIADDQAGPPETVVAELRPGYVWQGTVIRCAEVCAVLSRTRGSQTGVEQTELMDSDDIDPRA
ncbi:MAG: nucleotide exchange factor GrpE [Pirellulaceae bacterium]